ncbi:SAM-dependent methyltransferase [Paenibacillus sp. DS2015]|uniref:class I SAM-dependent methyltransferase n=1 Tax=Paenibacillus sp. DS2015 TaxID=3373917 RepID=UPI003D23572C
MKSNHIKNQSDLFQMLDHLFNDPKEYWNTVYQERPKYMPFLTDSPDENLVDYFINNTVQPGRVLELGCGEGRNAIYMASKGCQVDAIDLSTEAIKLAVDHARIKDVEINFQCGNVFDLQISKQTYDLVYDSGLLHHLLPHRRVQYIELLNDVLKPGGCFALICFSSGFTENGGAEETSDYDVYKERRMLGGMAFSQEKLQYLLSDYFELIEIRHMKDCEESNELFGVPFMWASIWRKK